MADAVKILFGFFMAFTIKDLFLTQFTAESSNKEIPNMNLGPTKYMGPSLKILYCYSCGYRNAFEQYVDVINKKYPDMVVEGGLYPPPGYNSQLASVLSFAKIFILLGIVIGANISQYLGPLAPTWSWCTSNKLYSCMMIYFIGNMIEGQLISTGAFEITFNDVPVWSKLETGRIPQPLELFQIIDSQLQFQASSFEAKPEIPSKSFVH